MGLATCLEVGYVRNVLCTSGTSSVLASATVAMSASTALPAGDAAVLLAARHRVSIYLSDHTLDVKHNIGKNPILPQG